MSTGLLYDGDGMLLEGDGPRTFIVTHDVAMAFRAIVQAAPGNLDPGDPDSELRLGAQLWVVPWNLDLVQPETDQGHAIGIDRPSVLVPDVDVEAGPIATRSLVVRHVRENRKRHEARGFSIRQILPIFIPYEAITVVRVEKEDGHGLCYAHPGVGLLTHVDAMGSALDCVASGGHAPIPTHHPM